MALKIANKIYLSWDDVSQLVDKLCEKIINEQPTVLFDVFLSIFKTIGKEHYEMMMKEEIQE
jgi:hypothetical protein